MPWGSVPNTRKPLQNGRRCVQSSSWSIRLQTFELCTCTSDSVLCACQIVAFQSSNCSLGYWLLTYQHHQEVSGVVFGLISQTWLTDAVLYSILSTVNLESPNLCSLVSCPFERNKIRWNWSIRFLQLVANGKVGWHKQEIARDPRANNLGCSCLDDNMYLNFEAGTIRLQLSRAFERAIKKSDQRRWFDGVVFR